MSLNAQFKKCDKENRTHKKLTLEKIRREQQNKNKYSKSDSSDSNPGPMYENYTDSFNVVTKRNQSAGASTNENMSGFSVTKNIARMNGVKVEFSA